MRLCLLIYLYIPINAAIPISLWIMREYRIAQNSIESKKWGKRNIYNTNWQFQFSIDRFYWMWKHGMMLSIFRLIKIWKSLIYHQRFVFFTIVYFICVVVVLDYTFSTDVAFNWMWQRNENSANITFGYDF